MNAHERFGLYARPGGYVLVGLRMFLGYHHASHRLTLIHACALQRCRRLKLRSANVRTPTMCFPVSSIRTCETLYPSPPRRKGAEEEPLSTSFVHWSFKRLTRRRHPPAQFAF